MADRFSWRVRLLACLAVLAAIVSAGFTHGSPPVAGLGNFTTALNVTNIYALRKIYPPYNGPAVRLQRVSDGAQLDFSFNAAGNLPRQAIQDWAGSRSIAMVTIYDQSPVGNNLVSRNTTPPFLTLSNSNGYPEVTVVAGQYLASHSASSGKGLQTVIARLNANCCGVLLSQDSFNGQFRITSGASYGVGPDGGPQYTFISLGTNSAGTWVNLAGSFSNLYSTNNINGYHNGAKVSSASVAPFVFTLDAGDALDVNDFIFGGQDLTGSWQEIVITYDELSSGVIGNFNTSDNTYYSTPLPDTLGPVNPTIAGATPSSALAGHTSLPFANVAVTDTNTGSPTDSVTITLSGTAGGTLSGTALTGTGPYTLGAASAATITSELKSLVYTPAGALGTSETFTLAVTSSAGTSASNSSSVVSVVAPAPAETAFAAPVGTFAPVSYKGVNIIGAESAYPATSNAFSYIYPDNRELDYYASKGFGMIRMSTTVRRMQPASYGALDPGNRTDELPNGYVTYPAGSQTNLLEIKRVLDHAFTKGIRVMIEPHDYGYISDTLTNTTRLIGRDAEATAQFVDWWTRMSTVFKNYPNVVFNLINEPHDQTAAESKTGMVAAINGIATITTAQLVTIPGTYFTSAFHWANGDSGNSTAWAGYTPPAGMTIAFDMHNYLDVGQAGQNIACQVGVGSSSLTLATAWARTNGFKIILGEVGWSTDSTCTPEATTFMAYMTSNADVWQGWTYFNGGSFVFYSQASYAYCVTPNGAPNGPFTDAPQMSILLTNK